MLFLLNFINSSIFKLLLSSVLVVGLLYAVHEEGYTSGVNATKITEAKQEKAAEAVVLTKTVVIQGIADTSTMALIVYRDKVETKYKTINNYITTYEKDPTSFVVLDPVFVRLHDDAASPVSDSDSDAGSTSGPTSDPSSTGITSTSPPVTTGQAIAVITDNYKDYNICREKVIKWNAFYSGVKSQVNK
jgi:hypothetical protein